MKTGNICPACGYDDLIEPPYTASRGSSYEICPSCAFEFGYSDDNDGYTFESWRQKWIDAGMPWSGSEDNDPAPKDWDPVAQLRNLSNT